MQGANFCVIYEIIMGLARRSGGVTTASFQVSQWRSYSWQEAPGFELSWSMTSRSVSALLREHVRRSLAPMYGWLVS
jgi:hypothetical protein